MKLGVPAKGRTVDEVTIQPTNVSIKSAEELPQRPCSQAVPRVVNTDYPESHPY